MDDKELDLQAEETLAITNPDAYSISNPTPRDWTMSAQEIARSIKINPIEALTTKAQREGPEKWNWLETVVRGTLIDPFVSGVQDIDEAINVRNMEFSSPDMSPDEAERLMQDALYTRHFLRQTRQADTAEKLKYKKWYDFSNAVGSAIKYAGIGIVTGSPMAIGMLAGIESGAQMEADLVDRYIEKTGDIEGYTKEERIKDLGIAGSYAVFNGITETMLGVERLATGALGRYSTIEALSRLARAQGKLGKSVALKALRRAGMTALEEGTEEFIQSFGEDIANAIAGYGEELGSVEGFKKALTSAIYGAIIGGTMGWGLYRYNRKSIVDKINKWNNERGAGLDEGQMAEVADQIIEDGKTQMLDEIATRIEIKNQYGPAFDAIKSRIKEQLEATGTVPWTDPNKTLDQFAEENARMISIPALYAENVWGIPMSTFIDVAKLTTVPGYPYLMFEPITSIEDAKALIEDQKLIVKEQTDAKKLGIDKEGLKEAAQRRIALLNTLVRNMEREQGIATARSNKKKAQADYITAKDLKPESTGKIETAVQAEEGQEYVMFAGQRIPVEYQVVELADIQPSHIDGEPNPNYTNVELQNRASRGTVQDVADLREKATNITPERLLRAPTSAEGAPVVNELGEVIAGNGRAEIIRYAYENPETAEKYRQALTKAGFNTEGMTQPVLVRRNTTMTPEEQVAAAELSNISETSAFDEASQAKRDSQYLKDSESPTDFAGKIPMSERRGLMQNNGKWNNRQVKQRYEDALLSWLTGNDTQLFESLVLDGNISQKVLDTLVANGSLIHTVATQYPDTNLREDIYHALLKMQLASKDNFIELTQQIDISGRDVMPENILVWNWLFADATTNRQFLSNYATILRQNHESMDNGQDMFGDKVAPLSRKDALMQALKKTDEARAQMAADRGREYESLFAEETGEVKNPELAAAIASYQNQFAPEAQMEQTILNKQQFDLADQNARLDEIYPEYTGETIVVDGKERTVYNSEGERINKSAEALTNFWRWFGDSKVVDEQGRPIVVYHGTDAEFDTFAHEGGFLGNYFTDNKDVADYFSKYGFHPENARIIPVYLKAQNPLMIKADGQKWSDLQENGLWQDIRNAKETGHDGVIIYDIKEGTSGTQPVANDYVVFEPTQIKSTQNRGTYSPDTANIYNKIAYTSGKTFYLSPSTRFVLRGGEGQIVHGWGIYLLENMLENARLYRNKFSSGLLYVENMPEENKVDQIIAYNGLVGESAKKFKEYLSYVLENRPGWTPDEGGVVAKQIAALANITSYLNPLVNEKTTPVTAYFTTLANYQYDDPHNKYIRKQKDGKYKFIIPKNLPLGIKDVLQLTNKKISSAGWYDPYVVLSSNLESWLPDGNVSMFVGDLIDPDGTAKKTPLNKAIKEYTESILRQTNLEPRTTKTPRIAPNLTDEENVRLYNKSYFLGPLTQAIQNDQVKDAPTRAQFLIELLGGIDAEYKTDFRILSTAAQGGYHASGGQYVNGPTQTEVNKGSSFIQNLYDQAKTDYNTDTPTYEQINAEYVSVIENQEEWWSYGLLPRETIKAIFGEDISEEFEDTARAYIVQMVMEGKTPIHPVDGYKNVDLEQTTATVLDSEKQSDYIQMLAETVRRIFDGSSNMGLDEIITMMPKTYGGFWGLYALEKTWRNQFADPDGHLVEQIAQGEITFENLDKQHDYKEAKERTEHIPAFLVSVLERAKKIYKTNTDKNSAPDVKTWQAISDAIKSITDEEKEILSKKFKMDEKDTELFFKILTNPDGVKKTRGQQLEIEIPNANELLNEEQFLSDQASADKIKTLLKDFLNVTAGVSQYLEKDAKNLKDNAYAIKLGIASRYKDVDEWTEEIREEAWKLDVESSETSDEEKADIQKRVDDWAEYIMEHMRGESLYRLIMDTLPDMIWPMKDGTELGGDTGVEKDELYDPDKNPTFYVLGNYVTAQNAKEASMLLNDYGIKGTTYRGGTDGRGYVIFSDEAIKTLRRMDDDQPMYYKKGTHLQGQYDKDLQTILLTKYWDETTFVHEMHHRYLDIIWGLIKKAEAGTFQANAAFIEDTKKLMEMLDIDPKQDELTVVQQEKFATMVEAYVTGLGVDDQENLAFQGFLHWVPEKYRSIMDLGYLDAQGKVQNPILDQASIDFFNRWFASPLVPSLPSAPDAQRMVNPTDDKDEIIPSSQKVMNDREKEWGQDSEIQNKADAQLWKAIGENNPSDLRSAIDGQEEINKLETNNQPDDRLLPEPHKPTLREKWFKARQPDARELAAEKAREYVAKNPEHARELAFADPETLAEFDAPVDQGMLIRAVMETVGKGSDEWYILDNNLAMVKSMSGSTLALSGDLSHQAYLDAKREVEAARELKAAINYAGTRFGALDKWNMDIRAFAAKRTAAIMATEPRSKEREVAIKAFLEEAKTKFSGNTTNAVLNKLDLTGYQTKNSQAFIKWAEKQIKNVAHAQLDTKEQAELMNASVKAQLALRDIDSRELKDGQYVRAVAAAKDIRHWQFVKDKMKKAYIGRWGKFGIWFDNLVSSYVPSAMLMSFNTLFFANVPSTAINNTIVKRAARLIGDNKVDDRVTAGEVQRIKQIFNASGMNLAQMEKPTSPSLMHGEKYTNQEQKHWYNFTFDVLSKEDNWFRIPTFVDALARIATRDAKGDKNKATMLFKQYAQLNDQTDEAKIARKEALAVANMAVFTQDGMMASALNHIRSNLNTLTRTPLGLDPNGFGLGNILAPFLKTGANVIEMGITATLAPVRTAVKGLKVARGKTLTDMEKIALKTDWAYFCLAAVATAIMAAISGDDDDWYEEPYEPGRTYDPNKPYDSIRIGNTWIKLDIFGPLEVPLRTAAMLVKNWEDKKLAAVGNGLYEALGEVPLVNQFVDSNTDYMSKYPGKWASGFGYNQLNKLVPAQVKTLTRAGSRATGTTVDMGWTGKTIQKKFHRNYGLDGAQLTTNDLINILTNRLKYTPK